MQIRRPILLGLALLLLCSGAVAQEPSSKQSKSPDNTKVNERARSNAEPTADQQKENKSDRKLARQVRRALVKDKSLSTYAHNIKVIAQDGSVTLKGPVNSDQEKKAVEAKAAEVVGSDKVKSEIEVAPSGSNKPSPDQKQPQ